MRKIILVFILVLLVSPFFLAQPKKIGALTDGGGSLALLAKEIALDTVMTNLQNRLMNKMLNDTLNWAAGGFDGEPGFINNWGDFLKGTEHDVFSGAYGLADTILGDVMQEYGVGGDIGGDDPGGQAQQNYNLWASGELNTARMVAGTIANFGAQHLNVNPLQAIIRGEGETLSKVLGSQQAKEAFKTDFSVGGWGGYLALIDPHNTDIGLNSLVQSALSNQAGTALTQTVQDIQTENKFLNRATCVEYQMGSDGEEICARQVTDTPGNIVSSRIFQASGSDFDRALQAREVSDVLARALGRLTQNFLQQGVAKLVGGGSSGGTAGFIPNNVFLGDYQSGYDILGLNLGGGEGGFGSGTGSGGNTGGGIGAGSNPFGDFPSNSSLPYIGGPEDQKTMWNEGPEIIIDLQRVLEPAIKRTQAYLEFQSEREQKLREGFNNIIKLDRCVPGPGYGWEERMRNIDHGLRSGTPEDARSIQMLGFNETKQAANDPYLNIPGAERMKAAIASVAKQEGTNLSQISSSRQEATSILSMLLNIESQVRSDFNTYLSEENLPSFYPLFESDWDALTSAQQLEIFSLEYPGTGIETSLPTYLVSPYYLFKPGETPASVLAENPEAAKHAVLSFAWNLWQEKKGQEPATEDTPSGTIQKSNLRYRYYVMERNIVSDTDVLQAELNKDVMISTNRTIADMLHDCVQFKSFATGIPYTTIDNGTTTNNNLLVPPRMSGLPTTPLPQSYTQEVRILSFNPISDQIIKNYVLNQRAIQLSGGISDFRTDVITGAGALENSILGFDSVEAIRDHIDNFYTTQSDLEGIPINPIPDTQFRVVFLDDLMLGWGTLPISVANIYAFDFSWNTNTRRGARGQGFLYCRDPLVHHYHQDDPPTPVVHDCFRAWYDTPNIELMSSLLGI